MRVLLYVGHTVGVSHRTGIQRVVLGLAHALRPHVTIDFVKWDSLDGQLRYLNCEDLQLLFGASAPIPHRLSQRVQYRFVETIEQPDQTWLLYPEISYHQEQSPWLASMLAQARDGGLRTAAIFYDLIPVTNPAYASFRGPHLHYLADLLRFDLVLPISRWSAAELERFLGRDIAEAWHGDRHNRIVPVPLPELPAKPAAGMEAERPDADRIVLLGTVEPRKRQVEVLRAFTPLQESGRIPISVHLDVFGALHPDVSTAFTRELRRNPRIHHYQRASDEIVAASCRRALFSIFASAEEGFGLPIAESLAHGLPCLTANFGAMQEVGAGGGCMMIDVRDHAALTDAIAELTLNKQRRATLRAEIAARPVRNWNDYALEVLSQLSTVNAYQDDLWATAVAGIIEPGTASPAYIEIPRAPGAVAGEQTRAPWSLFRLTAPSRHIEGFSRADVARAAAADIWALTDPAAEVALIQAAARTEVPGLLTGIVLNAREPDLDPLLRDHVRACWRRDARAAEAARQEEVVQALLATHGKEAFAGTQALSIIVSTYNRGPFIEMNAGWLLRITDLPGETIRVVVVDNASTDDTVERLARFAGHPRFTLWVNSQNTGMLGNLRVCAALARSNHVWLTGDDDFILPEALRAVVSMLGENPAVPLASVNFAVYHRSQLNPGDRPELLRQEAQSVGRDVLPSGLYPLNTIATQHDNLFTAIYPLIFRTDLLRACFNYPFNGIPFGTLTESVPTTRFLLETCRYFKCYWHAPISVVGNAHNSWSRHRPRWHAVLMPQVFELAREAGADPVKLQQFANIHLPLYQEALAIAAETGGSVPIESNELGPAHRVFRTLPQLPAA